MLQKQNNIFCNATASKTSKYNNHDNVEVKLKRSKTAKARLQCVVCAIVPLPVRKSLLCNSVTVSITSDTV